MIDACTVVSGSMPKYTERILNLSREISEGISVSSSLCSEKHGIFDGKWLAVLKSGELSGTLDMTLSSLAEHIKKINQIKSKIKSAAYYPLFVGISAFFAVIFLMLYVMPKIIPMLSGMRVELPLLTRIVLAFSHFFQRDWMFIITAVFSLPIFFAWYQRSEKRMRLVHKSIYSFWGLKDFSKYYNLCTLYRTTSLMYKTGYSLPQALSSGASTCSNVFYREKMSLWSEQMKKGSRLSNLLIFEKETFAFDSSIIVAAERSGTMENALDYLSEYYENKLNSIIKVISSTAEPVLLIFVGSIVALVALSVILPIYKMTGSMGT